MDAHAAAAAAVVAKTIPAGAYPSSATGRDRSTDNLGFSRPTTGMCAATPAAPGSRHWAVTFDAPTSSWPTSTKRCSALTRAPAWSAQLSVSVSKRSRARYSVPSGLPTPPDSAHLSSAQPRVANRGASRPGSIRQTARHGVSEVEGGMRQAFGDRLVSHPRRRARVPRACENSCKTRAIGRRSWPRTEPPT